MTMERPIFDYIEESAADKLKRKSKESPFLVIGLAGLVGACGLGAYKYRTRGAMSTSVFLMQLRVIAQGTVVGTLTAGIAYQLVRDHLWKQGNDDNGHS